MSDTHLPESASAKETAQRVPIINDPIITEALRDLSEDGEPSERERLRTENEHLRVTLGKSLARNTRLGKAIRNLAEQIEGWVSIVKMLSDDAGTNYTGRMQAARAYLKEVSALLGADLDLIIAQAEQCRWENDQRVRCPSCAMGYLTPQLGCGRCGETFALVKKGD